MIYASQPITGAVGIEPTSMVLETTVLPLNYAPMDCGRSLFQTAEFYYSIRKEGMQDIFDTGIKL